VAPLGGLGGRDALSARVAVIARITIGAAGGVMRLPLAWRSLRASRHAA
jgi:hypothetical protein